MKIILKRVIGITLTIALSITSVCGGFRPNGFNMNGKEAEAAQSQKKYVKNIVVSYASSKEKAQEEFGDEYTVLDCNFNKEAGGNTWIGYSTTDNEIEAIRDIKAMNMLGKYSTSDYDTLLKEKQDLVKAQVDTIERPLVEYVKNLDMGLEAAKSAKKYLNFYYEDDSKKNLGDFFEEMGRALEKDSNDKTARKKLEKLFVEGNDNLLRSAETILCGAQNTQTKKKGSWISRMSELGPDGLSMIYKTAYPKYSKRQLESAIEKDLGDDAARILEELNSVRDILKDAENSNLVKEVKSGKSIEEIVDPVMNAQVDGRYTDDSSTDDIVESIAELTVDLGKGCDLADDIQEQGLIMLLETTKYGDKSMYDFFMDENLKKADLYTMAYLLSKGQKELINDIGLYSIFENAMVEYDDGDASLEEKDDEIGEGLVSIYEAIDRDIFKGDTAITEETLKWMKTKEYNDIFGANPNQMQYIALAGAAVGIAFLGRFLYTMLHDHGDYQNKRVVNMKKLNKDKAYRKIMDEIRAIETSDDAWKLKYLYESREIDIPGFDGRVTSLSPEEIKIKLNDGLKRLREVNKIRFFVADTYDDIVNSNQTARAKYIENIKKYHKWDLVDLEFKYSKYVPDKTRLNYRYRFSWGSRLAALAGAVAAFAFVGYEIYCITRSTKVNYTDIPKKMLARTFDNEESNDGGLYATYSVVTNTEGEKADIHKKKADEWQVLYTTKDSNVGEPILADSLLVTSENVSDQSLTAVKYFYSSSAVDFNEKDIIGKEASKCNIYFKKDVSASSSKDENVNEGTSKDGSSNIEASVFGNIDYIWIILVLFAFLACLAGIYFKKLRKNK